MKRRPVLAVTTADSYGDFIAIPVTSRHYLKHAPDVPDSDVTVDYCARHNWVVGSPSTVAEKIETIYREVGGFGTLLVFGFDYKHKPEAWHNSLRLLKQEVMPRLKHLNAELVQAA
jgi:alkanesulfonate monooxygenase SsuD/methylene tetrahydromethanopterin reductase-like flavin-dependent oxidoreductase (luciferase family)